MELEYELKNGWNELEPGEMEALMDYSERYMQFLNEGKTERECVRTAERLAKENGFVSFEEVKAKGWVKEGDKIYAVNREKAIALFVIGAKPLENGMRIVGAHVDAPRLDVKAHPFFEDENLVLLRTHYYGGIKKYQWTAIPLALHGVVVKENGEKVDISIGEDEKDPVFYITDLLPHLSKDQNEKKLAEGVTGEQLTPLFGHIPMAGQEKNPVKKNILKLLHEKFGITETDFVSAELEVVPAGKARDVGLDRSMIAAHGHDDRVCSYAALEALLKTKNPDKTAVTLLVDKEEVGSIGSTGMQSRFFENIVAELVSMEGGYSDLKVRRALSNTEVLSADVCAAVDPNYAEVHEKSNAARMGAGISLVKYSGARGKSGCNDANAEFLGKLRKLFHDNHVIWQTSELGKVDQGGGGTIAYILANYGAEVVDCGTGMLSMHAPVELVSKMDAYMTYKAYFAFFK